MSESTNTEQNDLQKSDELQQQQTDLPNTTCTPNKLKLFKIKEGELLHYKRKLFYRNWRPAQLTLYSNGSFLISSRRNSTPVLIKCEKSSTLIIFGSQLDSIPKRPTPPSGNKLEHMLAIGLISCNGYTNSGKLRGTQINIIFYWFSLQSQDDLINWVVAFQNSIYSNFSSKPNQDIQTVTNNIALNNAAAIGNLNNSLSKNTNVSNDGIALGLLMANTTAFPDSFNLGGVGTGLATVGAGLVAANTQYQAILDGQRLGPNSILLSGGTGRTNIRGNTFLDTSGDMKDDSTVHIIPGDVTQFDFQAGFESNGHSFSNELNNLASDLQFAEMASVLNAADYIDCGVDCSIADCSIGDCSFGGMDGANVDCGGDFSFAFAI